MADNNQPNSGQGPKYFINIDGKEYDWDKNTITAAELRTLAGWSSNQAIDEVNLNDNSKVTLSDSSIVEIKPGHGFAKKIEFVSATVTPPGAHAL